MFNPDFFPTPPALVARMIGSNDLNGKTILEPSAGKGNLIDGLKDAGAEVICCEKHPELAHLSARKAKFLKADFFQVTSKEVSHIHGIYMNPPFSDAASHILHAWNISPSGCQIVALCNENTLKTTHTRQRRELDVLIRDYGSQAYLGDVFRDSERPTDVGVAMITLHKPGNVEDFGEFFTSEQDAPELQGEGIMPYNAVREVVQRYVNAVRLYDEVLENAQKMNALVGKLGVDRITFACKESDVPRNRDTFQVELQKKAWAWIFQQMNMEKYTTRGLRESLNKFTETQKNVPFTMKNTYRMFEMIVGTHDSRMDQAIVEVFDKITRHYDENRYNVEGWKTNSHYLVGRKFILPGMAESGWSGQMQTRYGYSGYSNTEHIEDLAKALCFMTGTDYNRMQSLYSFTRYERVKVPETGKVMELDAKRQFGQWYEWGFFRFKAFKKGTMHFEFLAENVWALFNQNVARIKGYPLPEHIRKSAEKTGKKNSDKAADGDPGPQNGFALVVSGPA